MLLDKGAHVRAMTRDGETPEDFASAAGHEEVIQVLYQVQIRTNMFVLVWKEVEFESIRKMLV